MCRKRRRTGGNGMILIKKKKNASRSFPTIQQLEAELGRVRYRRRYRTVLRSTVFTLITVSAIAVLIATLWLPVLQIYGTSMTPTLENGQIVVSIKSGTFETGDLVVFRYNNKILVKRLVAKAGDWVDIDTDGTVYVNEIAPVLEVHGQIQREIR